MTKAKGNTEKAKKNMTLEMIGLTRSSSQEVADGYGPSIQKSELIADARSHGYRIDSIRNIIEPATINLEERDLFNGVMSEAISLKKENKCDGLCFSRCDRLSRHFDAALQIALGTVSLSASSVRTSGSSRMMSHCSSSSLFCRPLVYIPRPVFRWPT